MSGSNVDLSPALLLDPGVIEDPYPFYDRVRRIAPVWRVPGTDIVVVTSYGAVADATARPADFSSHLEALIFRAEDGTPALVPFGDSSTNVLATADPPIHTVHRRTVLPALMAKEMRALQPQIDAMATDLVAMAVRTGQVDVMSAVANLLPIRVVSQLVGWGDEQPDVLFQAAIDSSAVLAATRSLDDAYRAMERTAEIAGWIAAQLARATEHGAVGLLGLLAVAVRTGDIDEMAGLIILHTLLSAGGESTTSLIGNATHALAVDQELQARLRAEPELIEPFIEEVLRLESPFRYHLRQTHADTELDGVPIPAGSAVLLMWGAANRDPAEFGHPNTIDLERPTPRHHLAFGRGIHLCVGAPLARIEATVVITRLLEMSGRFKLDPDQPPAREDSLMVRRFTELPLLIDPAPALREVR